MCRISAIAVPLCYLTQIQCVLRVLTTAGLKFLWPVLVSTDVFKAARPGFCRDALLRAAGTYSSLRASSRDLFCFRRSAAPPDGWGLQGGHGRRRRGAGLLLSFQPGFNIGGAEAEQPAKFDGRRKVAPRRVAVVDGLFCQAEGGR